MARAKDPLALSDLRRFERAVDALAFMGASHPDDWDAIDAEYQAAKKRLKRWLPNKGARRHLPEAE